MWRKVLVRVERKVLVRLGKLVLVTVERMAPVRVGKMVLMGRV
jgi:hypothetical protein